MLAVCLAVLQPAAAQGQVPMRITLATAGPGNLSHLPVDLITRIGTDRAEGVELTVRYFGGGPLAFRDMLEGNSDFAVAGLPALAALKARGEPVVSLATVNRVPTFTLMIRRDLARQVRGPADLKGRVIGINTSSTASKSTSQQLAEYVLQRAGVGPGEVKFVAAGQSYADQRSSLASGRVDALMGDEPFASRLVKERVASVLLDFHSPQTASRYLGGEMINAQLASRMDVLQQQPEKVLRMLRILNRTLAWLHETPVETIVRTLPARDPEMAGVLRELLRRYKAGLYSSDGAISLKALQVSQELFRSAYPDDPAAQSLDFQTLIDRRYAKVVP